MTIKKYLCECGREFDNSQKFNGHKSNCKIHLSLKGSFEQYKIEHIKFANIGRAKRTQNALDKKQFEFDKWIKEKHKCKKCGKVMKERFGSGIFCSRKCANSHIQTSESNYKRKLKMKKNLDCFCKCCNKKISSKTKYGYCRKCFRKFIPYPENAKKMISNARKGSSRWNIHRNQTSYAEKFFENVLNLNSISFIREYQVKKSDDYHCYYLDFLINEKFDLEIDGSQHNQRKKQDKERDDYLKSLGFIVYRIKWNEIKSKNGKIMMKKKINKLLQTLNV